MADRSRTFRYERAASWIPYRLRHRRHLHRLHPGRSRERGFTGRFHLIQSSGGLTALTTAAALPVRFLESGPAGSAQAAGLVGRASGRPDLISFDMGGTTAKASLLRDGEPDAAPVIDMIEIGAGGGSIARADELGLLKIGPDRAGADPGPACYGRGGGGGPADGDGREPAARIP